MNYPRVARLIRSSIEKLSLDLTDLVVYTEAATGNFAVTAPIAAAGGAETVYAIARSSEYGTASDAREETMRVAEELDCSDRIEVVHEKRPVEIGRADVVTNTGFVRPIDERVITWMKEVAVVPLMYEPWEFRDGDVDLGTAWDEGVPVLGTDESDPRVQTQRYMGTLAAKLAFENQIEVYNSRLVVVGGGRMAYHAVTTLERIGAEVTLVAPTAAHEPVVERRDAESFREPDVREALQAADALFVVDHVTDRDIVAPGGHVAPATLADHNPSLTVIHVCGPVDATAMRQAGLRFVPDEPAPRGYMSYTLGYVGPRPTVDLHAAGLKVGELLARERRTGASALETTETVSDHPLAMDFSEEFKDTYHSD